MLIFTVDNIQKFYTYVLSEEKFKIQVLLKIYNIKIETILIRIKFTFLFYIIKDLQTFIKDNN